MPDPFYDTRIVPGSDVEMDIKADTGPTPEFPNWNEQNGWRPKTDWSRDGIIANDD